MYEMTKLKQCDKCEVASSDELIGDFSPESAPFLDFMGLYGEFQLIV